MVRKFCTDTGQMSNPPAAHQAARRARPLFAAEVAVNDPRVRLPRKNSAPRSHITVWVTGSAGAEFDIPDRTAHG